MERKPITLHDIARMRTAGEKIAMVTSYDASFAALSDAAGADCLLVGDSLGMVLQGHATTLPVTTEQMAYHTACVARGNKTAFVIADMSFGSYQESREQALRNAVSLMAAGAQMVKVEGGAWLADTVSFLGERGIPVCAHLGLTPQSVHQFGGWRVQGKTDEAAAKLRQDAAALQDAGAAMLVLEMVPQALAAEITQALTLATIGIGAGAATSGQVLVIYDLLGIFPGRKARFVKNFMEGAASVSEAVAAYVRAVKEGAFPAPEHCY